MQPSYSYNMDPGFGQLSMVPDDSKMALGHNIKEEQRTKENPIPSENLKINQQVKTCTIILDNQVYYSSFFS